MHIKTRYQTLSLLFWLNHILSILYMSRIFSHNTPMTIENIVPLILVTFMLIDITYISACNVRENKIVSLFCGLLVLDCWYMLLLSDTRPAAQLVFAALSPLIWYVSIQFILMFLFQGGGYKFRKAVNTVLYAVCVAALVGIGLSDKIYALLYALQFFISWTCFLFVMVYHWRRIAFVLKSEWKSISFSALATMMVFCVYYFTTIGIPYHISNFGIYITILLFGLSVHGIVIKGHNSSPLSDIFSKQQSVAIVGLSLMVLGLTYLIAGYPLNELFVAINLLFSFIYLCNIILGQCFKEGKGSLMKESGYYIAIQQLQKEEGLKTEFANFLHDEILQDILSVKNMITKIHRPLIRDTVMDTLEVLNKKIREQMQDYHPVILKKLTLKENYRNLINVVSQNFPMRDLQVSFECAETLFLVEPYNVLVYRLIKELLTNIYKHSDGSKAWVTLTLKDDRIHLCVADNGTAELSGLLLTDQTNHKGLSSISEQIGALDGTMEISDYEPHGVCIQIYIPMKGDVSYQYFVS